MARPAPARHRRGREPGPARGARRLRGGAAAAGPSRRRGRRVADAAGAAALAGAPARLVPFDPANSRPRATPGSTPRGAGWWPSATTTRWRRPGWLRRSARPLPRARRPRAGARAGPHGRARARCCATAPAATRPGRPAAAALRPPRAMPRAEGASMAFRAAALRALGGFDEAFRFFHDETDLFWRWGERATPPPSRPRPGSTTALPPRSGGGGPGGAVAPRGRRLDRRLGAASGARPRVRSSPPSGRGGAARCCGRWWRGGPSRATSAAAGRLRRGGRGGPRPPAPPALAAA